MNGPIIMMAPEPLCRYSAGWLAEPISGTLLNDYSIKEIWGSCSLDVSGCVVQSPCGRHSNGRYLPD